MRPLTLRQALLFGGLTIAVADGVLAVARASLLGTPPIRVFQAVASGLMGQRAFNGGMQTLLIGLALHLVIATIWMALYLVLSRRFGWLNRNAWMSAVLYGVVVYCLMYFVVLPLSQVMRGPMVPSRVLPALAIHIVAVGFPAALYSRRVSPPVGA